MHSLCLRILQLPQRVFGRIEVQSALQQLVGLHLHRDPLLQLASHYAAMRDENAQQASPLGRLRALSISTSFALATCADGAPPASATALLEDAIFILPHVCFALQHPNQGVRVAALDLIAALGAAGKFGKASSLELSSERLSPHAPPVPILGAIDLIKFCGALEGRRAELEMDPDSLGPCFAAIFLNDTSDRAWKKSRVLCAHFLAAHGANLGLRDGHQHVGSFMVRLLGWAVGTKSPSVLQAHSSLTWPHCHALVKYSLSRLTR